MSRPTYDDRLTDHEKAHYALIDLKLMVESGEVDMKILARSVRHLDNFIEDPEIEPETDLRRAEDPFFDK